MSKDEQIAALKAQLAAAQNKPATVRVYMDISGEANAQLEALAQKKGMTKKGFLQMLVAAEVEKDKKAKK